MCWLNCQPIAALVNRQPRLTIHCCLTPHGPVRFGNLCRFRDSHVPRTESVAFITLNRECRDWDGQPDSCRDADRCPHAASHEHAAATRAQQLMQDMLREQGELSAAAGGGRANGAAGGSAAPRQRDAHPPDRRTASGTRARSRSPARHEPRGAANGQRHRSRSRSPRHEGRREEHPSRGLPLPTREQRGLGPRPAPVGGSGVRDLELVRYVEEAIHSCSQWNGRDDSCRCDKAEPLNLTWW